MKENIKDARNRIKEALHLKKLEEIHKKSKQSNIASSGNQSRLMSKSALSSLMQESVLQKGKKMKVISVTRTQIDSKEV